MKGTLRLWLLTPLFFMVGHFFILGQISGPGTSDSHTGIHTSVLPIMQSSARDSLYRWQENVVLHVNDLWVRPKDPIFFKAYVRTGPKQLRVSAGNVLKVELLDAAGELMTGQYHKIVNGASQGSLALPKSIQPGKYYLRAYTRWMLNFGPDKFAFKEITVGNPREKVQPSPDGRSTNTFLSRGRGFGCRP